MTEFLTGMFLMLLLSLSIAGWALWFLERQDVKAMRHSMMQLHSFIGSLKQQIADLQCDDGDDASEAWKGGRN